jgi:menaquinone-9 beta-reductase
MATNANQVTASSLPKTDVFVIGGGPAGLAAAIAAQQRGLSAVVADGALPPIDKACGEGLMPETLAALRELGVNIPPEAGFLFRGIRFLENDKEVCGTFPQGPGLGIRRTTLHEWLIRRALQCGVRMLWQTPVAGITPTGIQLQGEFVQARWIVGADGNASRTRGWCGLGPTKVQAKRYAVRRHYRVVPWSEYVEVYWVGNRQAYVTPVSAEELCVVVLAETPEGAEFADFLRAFPALAERLGGAEVISRERGAVTFTHSLPSVHRGNVALVGDASGGVDAITGEGLRLAFRQAIELAEAMRFDDIPSYGRAHRNLARKPALMGSLLLNLGRNESLRARAFGVLASRPPVFANMLAVHSGDAAWKTVLSTGAQLGWRFLTT